MADPYDAVVVGSGATGGWAAKELSESGLNVALLEAGPLFPFDVDNLAPTNVDAQRRQPIQSTCPAFTRDTAHLFVDDSDNPYTTPQDKPYRWIRSRQVGGRLHVWGRLALRMSDHEFTAARRDGVGLEWPIGYADLAPYYAQVERCLEVSGTKEQLLQLPDGDFVLEGELRPGEEELQSAIGRRWKTRRLTSARLARRSSDAMLADALRTGRLMLRPNAVVSHIVGDRRTGKARSVAFVDRITGSAGEIDGRVIVLCASTIESTRILLNSATPDWPDGLGNSSGVLGHYLMDHTIGIDVSAWGPPPSRPPSASGDAAGGAYIPAFRNVTEHDVDFVRGYGIELEVDVQPGSEVSLCWMGAWGEVLPAWENRVSLDPRARDAWGIPAARIECAYGENEERMARDALDCLTELAEAGGYDVEKASSDLAPPGFSAHEMGTARMGTDPENSVLNRYNQSWDVKNVFVTDGACFTSGGFQNPTLTMMAITVRACRYIVEQLREGAL